MRPGLLDRLATLLDALGDVPITDAGRWQLIWLCDFAANTVKAIAALITRAWLPGSARCPGCPISPLGKHFG